MGCTPDRIRLVLVLGGVLDSVSGGDSVSVLKRDVVDVVVEDVVDDEEDGDIRRFSRYDDVEEGVDTDVCILDRVC